ncbi:unnamed protein product [Rotaria sp. Silwood1]|nr:unnamed protein product [Rotaria sp. Silwood1]
MNPTVDFYRLLGVDVNASAEAIRQAYKRKALEWHPDKRGNDIHAENMFKEIKKAYETLFNDSSKFEYDSKREEDDDDNNNDILLQNMCQLSHGKRPSQLYEEKITRWVNEYSNYTFKDNFQSEMTNITKTIFEKYKQEANIICIRIMCPTCCEYHDDLHEHIRAMKLVHNTFLQKICRSTSLNDLLASLAEDYWSWKPIEPAPSTFKELWFNPHWSSFEPLIRQLLPAVDILRSTKTNFSPVRKKTNYAEVEKIVQSICEKEPIIHGPNLTPLKQLIDAEYQIYRTGSDANSAHYSTGEQICIVENPDRNEILSPLMLVVQSPPIKSSEQPKCSSCLKSFGIFRRRYWCRMCGWTKWLGEQIQVEGYMLAAIFTLQLANFSTQEWAIVLNDLSDHNNFITVASVLRILNENLLNQIIASDKCTNHFLQLALQLLINGALGSVEKSLTRINYQSNIQQILFQLAVIHVFHLPDWQKVQNIFLPAEQCNQIIYCTKVCVLLRASSSLNFDWIQSGLESDQSIFYLLESLITNHSYMQLAVDHAKSKHIEIALNYYLLALNSSPQLPTVEAILSSASRLLSSSEALRCYIAVYKQMRTDTICALKALESLIDSFQTQKKPIISVLAAAVLTFDKSGNHLFKLYVQLLEELSKQFDENFSVIDAIHHFMNNLSTSTKSLSEKMQNLSLVYRQFLQTTVYKEVKQVVYENIIKLAVCLRDVTNIDALKHIRNEYFGNRDISTTPGEYRAKLYLIECMIARLENRNIEAVGKLNEAIAAYPVEDTTTAILTIMIDPSFHLAILKDLLNFVETLPIISEANSFASLVPPPPALFSAENLLKMNPNLRLLRKYERAILKRLNTDPLQSAFSYIDLCQAVHDPTCIVSNWTLACLYFYDLLSRTNSIMGKEAEVYAYRNVINELVSQAFLFSRVYLPPYMQIYIFRLLLPVVLQTAQIFRSSIARSHSIISSCRIIHEMVLPERENQLIYQLLNFTIHLTKVSPLIQLPTSLSFDILYREAVGQQFLVRFLEVMIEQDIEQSHLYEYYLFEGIWQGWARDHDFNKTRRTCMSAILDTKNWNMFDVQLLLDIPLIPRTDDGWLYRECRPLIFSSSQQFARIDGIAFDKNTGQVHFYFQPANNSRYGHNNALFDTVDVAEVFQRGLIQAIFTLNQPDNEFHAHPFQEMLYGPSSLLYTQYLATLLHTDYLLKMFTTGTEVCAKPPFEMRPIDEGFFERLPKHLQQKIQPLHKCDRYFSFGRAHRFWIEADEVIYEQQETDTSTIFWVADVRLRIRKHLLIRNSEGKLVDDENESEEEQRSAESLFAKAFTDHYDEIGIYFPELLRLKELLKLSALYAFARAQHQQLSKVVDYSPIMNHLTRVRSNLYEYPYNNYASVEKYYNQTLSDNGVSSWQVTSEQASELRSKIRQQLEQVDREVLDKLTQSLCEQTHTRVSNDVRALVKAWLDGYNNGTKDLAQFLAKEITNFHHQLKQPIEQLGIRLQHDDNEYETLKHPGESCNWVPAVFLSVFGSGRRIYGGVNLQLKLTEGYVPRNTSASTYNANNIFSNQSSIKSSTPTAGPRNNQERQNMRQELTQNSRRQTSSYGNNASGGGGNDRKPPKDPKPQPHWLPFGGEKDSRSETARAAHRLAKDQNRIPRSAQPEKVTLVKDRNPEARKNGKYNQFIRQYTYKNADGHLIDLRHDTPRTYAEEGGIGAQGPHVNAGPHGEKLHQHHWYGE